MMTQLLVLLMLTSAQASPYHGKAIREDSLDTRIFQVATDILSSPLVQGAVSIDTAVSHAAFLPPVGNQGSLGSCVAWAAGYYYKTWQENKKRGWSLSDPAHQFSPTFIYNQCNGGRDEGMAVSKAFYVLLRQGGASLATCPYSYDYNSWPSRAAYLEAMHYEIAEGRALPQQYSQEGVNALRQLLLSGEIGVMAIDTYQSFHELNSSNCDYCISTPPGWRGEGHAITIVGFDDGRPTADGVGAFLCVNSWGTNWGCNGYFWMTYQLFMSDRYHSPIYYSINKSDYIPRMLVNVNVSHQSSGNVDVSVLLDDPGYPVLAKEWNANLISFSPVTTLKSFPSYDIPIDISDFNPLLGTVIHTVYVKIYDHYADAYAGSVFEACTDLYAGDGLFYCSPYVPQNVPDYGSILVPIHVPTTSTAIAEFSALATDSGIELTWCSEMPQALDGFNVYRIGEEGGSAARINARAIRPDFRNRFFDADVARGCSYSYRVGAIRADVEIFSDAVSITMPAGETTLHQNYPNPFNPSTTVAFELNMESDVQVSILAVDGRIVRALLAERLSAGLHRIDWNGTDEKGNDVKSGVYLCRLKAGKVERTKKLVIIR